MQLIYSFTPLEIIFYAGFAAGLFFLKKDINKLEIENNALKILLNIHIEKTDIKLSEGVVSALAIEEKNNVNFKNKSSYLNTTTIHHEVACDVNRFVIKNYTTKFNVNNLIKAIISYDADGGNISSVTYEYDLLEGEVFNSKYRADLLLHETYLINLDHKKVVKIKLRERLSRRSYKLRKAKFE